MSSIIEAMKLSFVPETKICLVQDVFPEEHCRLLISAIDKKRSEGVEFEFPETMEASGKDFWKDKNTYINDLQDFDSSILEEMESRKKLAFAKYLEEIGDSGDYDLQIFAAAHTWTEGAEMYAHVDQYDGDSNIRHGLVMYLNKDMEGGEIYYPDYGIEVKPLPGLLVIHPGDIVHGVRPVRKGVRYNMTGFALKL